MYRKSILTTTLIVALTGTNSLLSATEIDGHKNHTKHGESSTIETVPLEAGQSGFAAIAEIVAILSADPDTDWSSIDINRLHEHLVDMDVLTLRTRASQIETAKGVVIDVTGDQRAIQAIQVMVPAHAKVLNETKLWQASTKLTAAGVTLKVESESTAQQIKLRALGFFGIMATGAHHQAHHLAISKGKMGH